MIKLTHENILQKLDHKFFRLISDTADELQLECYVIGGWVRDLFLQRPSKDIDIVVVDQKKKIERPIGNLKQLLMKLNMISEK